MNKVGYIIRETFILIKKHRLYFLTPTLVVLALLAVLVYYVGPSIITTFIYAGF